MQFNITKVVSFFVGSEESDRWTDMVLLYSEASIGPEVVLYYLIFIEKFWVWF